MKNLQAEVNKRLVAAMLVTVAVIGLSALAMRAPTQNQGAVALKSIQTDKATLLYADRSSDRCSFVERVMPGTSESKAATEHLKLVAATL
jgi:hypothetical protein